MGQVTLSAISSFLILFQQATAHPGCASSERSQDAQWYHPSSHPVHQLFSRQSNGTQEVFPKVGSRAWTAMFPENIEQGVIIPQAWLDGLQSVKSSGLIPNIALSNATGPVPIYPNGTDPLSQEVCSSSYEIKSGCRHPDDVWDAPAGKLGISFDDGPLPSSPALYTFLKEQNQTATHFFIGSNIRDNPNIFLQAFENNGDDMAVHTYTHPYLTSLSDEMVVAELGWTLEIIRVSTGGRIPRYYRPPYGDCDNRIRAIAKHVFGLTTVMWNKDSLDWELPQGPVTPAGISKNYTEWYSGPKSPGLVILSHELTPEAIQAFIKDYPLIKQNGWEATTIADLFGGGWYVNSKNSTSDVVEGVQVGQGGGKPVWDGYESEVQRLGTTTRLTFTKTGTASGTSSPSGTADIAKASNSGSSLLSYGFLYSSMYGVMGVLVLGLYTNFFVV